MADTATVHATRRRLIDSDGVVVDDVGRDDVERRLAEHQLFWLDLPGVGEEEERWMRDLFAWHPLAIEDALDFDERPKIEDYPDYTVLVLYGAAVGTDADISTGELVRSHAEVHCFVAEHYVVTVHRVHCPALHDLAQRIRGRHIPLHDPVRLVHHLADSLVDSFFPVLSALDERIDALEGEIIRDPRDHHLAELLDERSALNSLRKVVAPQRDIFAGLASGVTELPGFDEDASRYYRDVYDHLIRLADMIDSYRDLLSGATDAYLSVQSNKLNEVMKQLTIISTVFLPLSFLTGFFGQNFGFMVNHITKGWTFVVLGLGSEAVAIGALGALFARRGWIGGRR